jgi:signal transduction histidine kinase
MPASLRAEELNALIQVSKTVNAHLDLDAVLESVMTVTTSVMNVEASSLVLIDDETGDLLFHVAHGEKAGAIKPIRMKRGEGIVGWVVESGESVIVNDVANDSRFYKKVDEDSGFTTKAILCVPLETNNRRWGAIEVLNKLDGRGFDEHDQALCEAIAAQAAISIENSMLHEEILKQERLAAIGQTIAGLAHCIKNVLNSIRGGSFVLDLGLEKNDQPKVLKGWDIVKRNNTFMQELVLDMLTYSKERKPEYEEADVDELLKGVCEMMGQKAKEKNVTIGWTPNPDLNKVILDPKGIRRCLINLVSNAADACNGGNGGRVDLCAEVAGGETFCIKVADNGRGISEENKEKLFQMFFSTKGSKGTGLGLAVTHKIIKEHNGTIAVDSKVGEGTTFTITLPMRAETGTN